VDYTVANATSCGSLNAAYQAANSGDLVNIVSGTYNPGSVAISDDPSITSMVTFRPAPGAAVVFSEQVVIHANYVTIDGSTGANGSLRLVHNLKIENGAHNVTIAHADASGGQTNVLGSSYITLRDVTMGHYCGDPTGADAIIAWVNDHVIIEDSDIGRICLYQGNHPDCVSITSTSYLIFRRNRVYQCATQGFYPADDGAGRNDHLLVENNMFGDMGSGTSVNVGDTDSIVFRFNSFAVDVPGYLFGGNTTGWTMDGNAGDFYGCDPDVSQWNYNVWRGGTCSATDRNANPGFVKNTADDFDLHLASASSPACSRGKPGVRASGGDWDWALRGDFPATDYDGQPRSSPPDAGADERADC
jgi:hypothetical protein